MIWDRLGLYFITVIQNQIPFKENKSKAPQANNLRTCVLLEILLIFSKLIAKLLSKEVTTGIYLVLIRLKSS